MLLLVWFAGKMVSIPPTVHREQAQQLKAKEDEITRLSTPPAGQPAMSLKELALHLAGRTTLFAATITDFKARMKAIDLAVRDALGQDQLKATGRPTDFTNELVQRHETRTEIGQVFWTAPQHDIAWWSLGLQNPYERAAASNATGDVLYYDLEFARAQVTKLWAADYDKPLSLTELAALAEQCGWSFTGTSMHALDLVAGLRHEARRGRLFLEGRKDCLHIRRDAKLHYVSSPIPLQHWQDYRIDVSPKFFQGTDNFDVTSNLLTSDGPSSERYRDLFITNRAEAIHWLLNDADEWKGRAAEGSAEYDAEREAREARRAQDREP